MQRGRNLQSQVNAGISEELRLVVLNRDRWRCQNCGSMQNLEVHHLIFRSHGGQDLEENLITLCCGCHSKLHQNDTSQ